MGVLSEWEQRLRSWKELRNMLGCYGIRIGEEEAAAIWEHLDRKAARKSAGDSEAAEPRRCSRRPGLRKILEVWEKDNRRYVLWSDGSLEVVKAGSRAYDYMDRGFYRIGNFIIRSLEMPESVRERIKRMDRAISLNMDPFEEVHAVTLEEFVNCLDRWGIHGRGGFSPYAGLPEPEHNRECMGRFARKILPDSGVSLTEERIMINGKGFGMVGKGLLDFLDFRELLGTETFQDPRERLLQQMVVFMVEWGAENELELGGFRVSCSCKKGIILEGRETFMDNFERLVKAAPDMQGKEEFLKLQRELEEMPVKVREYLKSGLSMSSRNGWNNMPEFCVRMPLRYERGSWLACSPFSGKEFPVRGMETGKKKMLCAMSSTQEIESVWDSSNGCTPLKMLRVLENVFGEEALEIMKIARQNVEEANRKAQELLKEVQEKYRDRVSERKFECEKGFMVMGNIRNYFVNREDGNVFAYPSGKHICIMGKEADYVAADKVVSRIMLLLNDSSLRTHISTLDGNEEIEIGEI